MAQQTPSGIAATAGSAVQSSSRPPEEVVVSRTKANVAKAKRPKAKAKKSKKAAKSKVPTTVTLTNARESTMSEFLVGPQEKKAVIKIAKPLAPGASTTLKVGKGATCDMVAIATFEDVALDPVAVDICADRKIRITD
jgi:sRNA-binding protein